MKANFNLLGRIVARSIFILCVGCYYPTLNATSLLDLEKAIFEQVKNPYDVQTQEYENIQSVFRTVREEDLPPMVTNRCFFYFNNFKLIGDAADEAPVYDIIHLNNDAENKKNCVVLYATYNSPYPDNVYKILEALKALKFDGHVIYRIGGFPNIENGSLNVIEVPYAFKACAVREAQRLGYQNVLWLDSSLTPVRDLTSLFEIIENEGYFATATGSTLAAERSNNWINQTAFDALNITLAEAAQAPHLTMCTFGLNLHSEIGLEILRRLLKMAEEKTSFFCDWVDEAPMSAIHYKMQLKPSAHWSRYIRKDGEWDGEEGEHYFNMSIPRPKGRW